MSTVTVSPKFQVVIPKDVRDSIGLKVGEVLQVIQYGRRIEMIPVTSIKSMKGFLKGMSTHFEREEDR
jgi:AbrB family looped-hinge helix DNA binding protein